MCERFISAYFPRVYRGKVRGPFLHDTSRAMCPPGMFVFWFVVFSFGCWDVLKLHAAGGSTSIIYIGSVGVYSTSSILYDEDI